MAAESQACRRSQTLNLTGTAMVAVTRATVIRATVTGATLAPAKRTERSSPDR